MGCDLPLVTFVGGDGISIHAARMGCDYGYMALIPAIGQKFQSTQPEWAATETPEEVLNGIENFNPRSPNGLRHGKRAVYACPQYFNPRSPNGLRLAGQQGNGRRRYFNPRSPNGLRRNPLSANAITS